MRYSMAVSVTGLPSRLTRPLRVSSSSRPCRRIGSACPPARGKRAQPRQEFLDGEGFGQIVVGAGVDAFHLLALAAARGQHQDRDAPPGLAPGAQHGEAVEARQTEIEDHGIVGLGLAEELALLTLVRVI